MIIQMNNPGEAGASAFTATNSSNHYTTASIESQFRQAMRAAGVNYSGEIIADGKLHRFHVEGHGKSTKNGAYILHADGIPAGWFGDYKSGISQNWCANIGRELTRQENEANRRRTAEAKAHHEAEIHAKQAETAIKAVRIWNQAKPITDQANHQYLTAKRIQPHGSRLYGDALVIPIFNESDQLVNLQFIKPKGDKRFLSGGRKRGCFHIIGDISDKILICEGFATGASLFEESGQRVVVAFDAGNLLPVAKNIRELSPDTEIIICGDNDLSGVGQTKAREAALAVRGKIYIPPIEGCDWNDVLSGGARHG